jgi:Acetyltransferase (GNAT) domain
MDHALQQSDLFNGALTRLGCAPKRVLLPSGPAYVLRRFGLSLATRPQDCPAAYEALAKNRIRLLNTESENPALCAHGYRQIVQAPHIAELALSPNTAAMRAAMQPKWRRNLTRFGADLPQNCTLTHRAFEPGKDVWLLKLEAAQARTRRYRGYPAALTLAMSETSPTALRLFTLSQAGTPCAAMLFAHHGNRATYHIGWSGPAGRNLGAHWLLLWKAMQELPARRITSIELGLIDSEHGAPLARFKLGSGANTRRLGGTWARVLRP